MVFSELLPRAIIIIFLNILYGDVGMMESYNVKYDRSRCFIRSRSTIYTFVRNQKVCLRQIKITDEGLNVKLGLRKLLVFLGTSKIYNI